MSQAAAEKDSQGLEKSLVYALNWATILSVPAAVGLACLAEPLINLIYQRGSFDSTSASQTALALKAFVVGLWPISCQTMITRAFLAKKNTKTPAWIAVLALILNLFFALSLMGKIGGDPSLAAGRFLQSLQSVLPVWDFSHTGLALAGSLSTLVSCIALGLLLKSEQINPDWKTFGRNSLQCLLASLLMFLVLKGIGSLASGPLMLLIAIPAGVLSYGAALSLLGNREALSLKDFFSSRLKN